MLNKSLKNIVVLKNLPSNIVDEAIVILKSKKTVKKLELVENSKIKGCKKDAYSSDYIIKEAENIISNYINKIEENSNTIKMSKNIEIKYKKIKAYSIFISVALFFCLIRTIF